MAQSCQIGLSATKLTKKFFWAARDDTQDMTKPRRKTWKISNSGEWVAAGARSVLRQGLAILGLILIIIAFPIGFVTPFLPIGAPIGIVGVLLLGRNSIWGRRWMERVLLRHPWIERMAPNWLMKLVFGREKKVFKH